MTSLQVALLDDPLFLLHVAPDASHPERPERLVAARQGLSAGLGAVAVIQSEARVATARELQRVHSQGYVAALQQRLASGHGQLDGDTYFCEGTQQAAWSAAGGVIDLCASIWNGSAQQGFALVRPPGHHAERDRPMGFCLLNNIAIAAADLLERGARRVAIVDWDVHHGNGTQQAFYSDPRVLFISLHQADFYPGTGHVNEVGHGPGQGFNCNVPLPAGSGPEAYAEAFRSVVVPLLSSFDPEMVLASAGFDAHRRDPLASMLLEADSYGAMAAELITCANRSAQGRIAWVLEGGYDLDALHESFRCVGEAALGKGAELHRGLPSPDQAIAIECARAALKPWWPQLR